MYNYVCACAYTLQWSRVEEEQEEQEEQEKLCEAGLLLLE